MLPQSIMNILFKQSDYIDMTPCCGLSLFEKGNAVPDSARDDWSLNDFGYFEGFPLQWKFVNGFEAPMAVYSYQELWVGSNGRLAQLPSNGEEKFRDSITHFPGSADSRFFIATTAEHKQREWVNHLLIYDLHDSTLLHRITHSDYMRPIQFIDNARMLVLKPNGLYVLMVTDGTLSPLILAENCVYINAHLSADLTCACAVRATDHESKPIGATITHLATGVTADLKFGANAHVNDQARWLANCTIPIRVHNGMVNLVATEAA